MKAKRRGPKKGTIRGPQSTACRVDGKRMEVYVRPAAVVLAIEERCRNGLGRQEVLLGLIVAGLRESGNDQR